MGGAPAVPSAAPGAADGACSLLVVVGPDPQLRVDLAALRKVRQQTGLNFHRLTEATAEALDSYMRRERKSGRPVRLLHMAVHASADGVTLADRVVDGNWLSERLLGVQVLVPELRGRVVTYARPAGLARSDCLGDRHLCLWANQLGGGHRL